MTNDMKYYAIDKIYSLCNRKKYFTSGTCSQYDKMFYMVKSDRFTFDDVALAIWLCSNGADLEEIKSDLKEIENEIIKIEAEQAEEEKYMNLVEEKVCECC